MRAGCRLLLAAVLFAAPVPVGAQAVCSAPHTAGGFSGGQSGGRSEPGSGWLQLSGFHQRSDAIFGPEGGRRPLLANGVASTSSLYATASIGVLPGVEAWLQAPIHHLVYEDQVERRSRTGLGDVRAALRITVPALGFPVPVAVRAGVKLPGREFPVDSRVIPLTEGQRDWELSLEHGRSLIQETPFAPPALYTVAWVGYRWRETDHESSRKPGDELFAHLGFSGMLDPVFWGLDLDALWGRPPVQQRLRLPGAARRLWQVTPSLTMDAGPGDIRAAVQFSLAGENLPTGTSYSLSYRVRWN
jgi:hypothetical protein